MAHQGCATISTVPAISRTNSDDSGPRHRPCVRVQGVRGVRGLGGIRRQGDLQPPLRRPQHPLADQSNPGKERQATQDPSLAQRIGALAHGDQDEAENGDAIHGTPGPIDPGAEVAPQWLGEGLRRPYEAPQPAGCGGRRRRRHEADDDTGHVEQQHDVESGSIRLVVHGDTPSFRWEAG